jgi:hypothetical protein
MAHAEFVSVARTNDTQFDWPAYVVGGPVRETRQLQPIRVLSRQGTSWDLVRVDVLTQDYSLYSDARRCSASGCTMSSGWEPETGYQKLTLKSIQRRDKTGLGALPALSFTYSTDNTCPTSPTWNAQYVYDAGTNGKGRRTSMSTSDGTGTTWTYTVRGQIASAVHTVGGMTGSWTCNWQYDSADRLKQITYPTASSGTETVVYGYDAAWRQQSVCISSGGCYAQAGTFDALNQPTSLTLGNTLRHTHPISAA